MSENMTYQSVSSNSDSIIEMVSKSLNEPFYFINFYLKDNRYFKNNIKR